MIAEFLCGASNFHQSYIAQTHCKNLVINYYLAHIYGKPHAHSLTKNIRISAPKLIRSTLHAKRMTPTLLQCQSMGVQQWHRMCEEHDNLDVTQGFSLGQRNLRVTSAHRIVFLRAGRELQMVVHINKPRENPFLYVLEVKAYMLWSRYSYYPRKYKRIKEILEHLNIPHFTKPVFCSRRSNINLGYGKRYYIDGKDQITMYDIEILPIHIMFLYDLRSSL